MLSIQLKRSLIEEFYYVCTLAHNSLQLPFFLRLVFKCITLCNWLSFSIFFLSCQSFWTDYRKFFGVIGKRVIRIWLIPWTHKKYFRKYLSESLYSWRMWHMTWLIHRNQHTKIMLISNKVWRKRNDKILKKKKNYWCYIWRI